MFKRGWGFFLLILMLAMFIQTGFAQEKQAKTETGIIINSKPPGAFITLDGEYRITATTPCNLPGNLSGYYKLKAVFPGYENWRGDVVIVPGQKNTFMISLSAKTRFKAALRSMFLPGWGQLYSERQQRGYLYNLVAIGLGTGLLLADKNYKKKKDDYNLAVTGLNQATSLDEFNRLQRDVYNKNRSAYDAETTRNTFLIVAAGFYVYNILDAVMFFPEQKLVSRGAFSRVPAVSADFNGDEISLRLTASF